ncbi:putative ferric-chelate reductase 1 isoform X2 [Pseudophryne corroboree]|uniref:putative ferric-chelate reductase 1 isoform X2 n=1 Tax=Pseudophryne corroboree TaxID=495146 RepID=UPI00308122CF
MENRLMLLICVAGYLVAVSGYPNGQISTSCDTMLPIHGVSTPQSSAAPYNIIVSKASFNAGDVITVIIQSTSGNKFKGFLLEARSVGGDRITGSFSTTDGNAQTLTCSAGANTAVSHTNSNLKSSITASWTAPEGEGPVRFRATVLSSYSTFWTGVQSDIIVALLQMSNTTCGSQKYCLTSPENCSPSDNNCLFMSAAPSSNGYVFEMSGTTSGYVAIGFSNDTKMGNDDVYICTRSFGNIIVQRAYTTGEVAPVITNSSTAGSIVTSYINGVLKCSFITQNDIVLPSQQRSSATSSYYVFLVSGQALANGQIQQHNKTTMSNSSVNLSNDRSAISPTEANSLVIAHGSLMLIAWMTTGSTGMIMARYMKSAAGKPVLGKAAWFQTHFFLMVLTVILTIIAFIMVFVEAAGWSYGTGAHPVIGCIVMVLSFFQPIAALFRPHPDNSRRFIFNWAHRLNALVIKILAVTAIFLGLILVDQSPTQWMAKVMGGFTSWEFLFYVILETNVQLKIKGIPSEPGSLPPRIELIATPTSSNVRGESRYSISSKERHEIYDDTYKMQVETVAILVFISGNLAFLISLLVGIGRT